MRKAGSGESSPERIVDGVRRAEEEAGGGEGVAGASGVLRLVRGYVVEGGGVLGHVSVA